jgi:hypothetical protein
MSDPSDRTLPYWWQSVAAAPFGSNNTPFSTVAQPDQVWSQSRPAWARSAMPPSASSGALSLPPPATDSWLHPAYDKTSLLGQLPPPTMGSSTQIGEADPGNYGRTAATRAGNMGECLWRYVKCQDLHGFGLLINGKRCGDCFNMCTLSGTWPDWYCPLRPF